MMRRLHSTALALAMLISCTNTALALSRYEYTWYDAAQTQMKTQTYFDDDGILRNVIEYPAPGDTTYDYIISYLYKDGGIRQKETASRDASGNVHTYIVFVYDEAGEVSSSNRRVRTNIYDENGINLGHRIEAITYDASGRMTYKSVQDSIAGTSSGIWYQGKNGAVSRKEFSSEDANGLVETRETLSYDYETGDLSSKSVSIKTTVLDENGIYLGYSEKTETMFFGADGSLIKTESIFREYDDE